MQKSKARMTCGHYLHLIRKESAYFEEIGRKQAIVPWYQDDELKLTVCHDRISAAANRRFHDSNPQHAVDLISTWVRGQIAAEGPKLFRPTIQQCLAMEQIAPRIPVAEYAQPYPVMIVELPEGYIRLRTRPTNNPLFVGDHSPEFVIMGILSCERPTLVVQVGFSSSNLITIAVLSSYPTIDDVIIREFGEDAYFGLVCSATPEERSVMASAARLGVNAMLLFMEYGCKSCGPTNEGHYRQSFRRLKHARERGQPVADAEREFRMATQLYDFEQRIVLHDEVRADSAESTSYGEGHRQPHWRRGYWKQHAYGPHRSQRKRILIKPVLVNKHLLEDNDWHAATTYRTE